ncbi:MAG TPA: hypothetical protein VJC39_04345 [Candidatus Nanoarchaeia archaeon]|nr:hypothetical protein [Candidatus Nanoarchaeia archaeon]
MAQIITNISGNRIKAAYVAVPENLNIEGILSRVEKLAGKTFPYVITTPRIEGHKALVKENSKFADVTLTYGKRPVFEETFYDLTSKPNLKGFTTLNVTVVSNLQNLAEELVEQVLEGFPEVINLKIQPPAENKLRAATKMMVSTFGKVDVGHFNTYLKLRSQLKEIEPLADKKLITGSLIELINNHLDYLGLPFDPAWDEIRLLHRVEGTKDGEKVELALIYMSGDRIPGTRGALVTAGGYCTNNSECGTPRSFAGQLISPQQVFYGGVKNFQIVKDKHFDHITLAEKVPSTTSLEEIEFNIGQWDNLGFLDSDHRQEIKKLARIFYSGKDGRV